MRRTDIWLRRRGTLSQEWGQGRGDSGHSQSCNVLRMSWYVPVPFFILRYYAPHPPASHQRRSQKAGFFLAPTRSPRSHFVCLSVCLSVRPAQSCLEHSIFILEPQILHDDFMKSSWRLQDVFRMSSGWLQDDFRMNQRALSKHSESTQSTQRSLRRHSENT